MNEKNETRGLIIHIEQNMSVEEVAERFWRNDDSMSDYVQQAYITGFIAGSKWQQEQAKEIEKEQIRQAYNDGKAAFIHIEKNMSLEEYYYKTYKNETK